MSMPKTFIFVRHGHYDKTGLSEAQRKTQGLSPRGRECAAAAAGFLVEHGHMPDLIFTTGTERTRETAERILDSLGIDREIRQMDSGLTGKVSGVDANLKVWLDGEDASGKTIMLCGHNTCQSWCSKHLDAPVIDDHHSCVFVFERRSDGWRLVEPHHGGTYTGDL